MTSEKQTKETKDSVDRAVSGITDMALAGAGAAITTGVGAGLIGALKA